MRVWTPGKDSPGIAMTRSFGDEEATRLGVTWEPEIDEYEIGDDDKFLLLASDGIWDIMTNKECL